MSTNDSAPGNTGEMLDWTMTTAPSAEEVVEAPTSLPPALADHHPHHPHQFSRWMWMTLGGLMMTALLGLMVFSWGNRRQVAADIHNVFQAEEEAILDSNAQALTNLTARGYTDWLNTRLRLAQGRHAAPAPALLIEPQVQAGTIVSISTYAPDLMQVDILRAYTGPGDETLHFATTQFYQYQEGWKRTPTPPYFSGELRQFEGRRLSIIHFERDASFINDLGLYLDDLLQEACAEWDCADNFNLSLQFLEPTPEFETLLANPGPLVFNLLAYPDPAWLDASPLSLPAPHIVGTPTDAASQAAFQRVVGQQVLLYAAQRYISEADGATRNALAYALTARLAVRLDLDSAEVLHLPQGPVAYDLLGLWDMRAGSLWEQGGRRTLALRSALMTLSELLHDQPLEIEQALFQQFRRRNYPRGWLADGLGLDYADIQAQLVSAGRTTLTALLRPEAEPTLSLQCTSGPQLYYEAEQAVGPFVGGPFFDAQISGWPWLFTGNQVWSPDGNYLLLSVSGQRVMLNLAEQSLNWLDIDGNEYALLPRGWISDTVVAYLAQSEVRFADLARPEQQLPSFPATDYVLSPDGRRAALVWNASEGRNNGIITVLATGGEELLAIDAGFSPIWMKDGSVLVYGQYQTRLGLTTAKLRQAEIVNGLRYTVQEGDSMWSIVASHNTSFDAVWRINQMTTNLITPGQVLVLPIQDSPEQVVVTRDLFTPEGSSFLPWEYVTYLTGSPDGQTLAVVLGAQADEPYGLLLLNLNETFNNDITFTLLDTAVGNPERLIRASPGAANVQLLLSRDFQFILPPRFSADGEYVALLVEEDGLPTLKIYAVASGRPLFSQPEATSYAWSPTGHRLAVTTDNGTFIVNDTLQTTGSNTVVTQEVCTAAWWRP